MTKTQYNFEDRFVDVNGVKTRYWHVGSQGPVVLLIHGLSSAVEYWAQNIESLAEVAQVYAIDLVGFGQTDKRYLAYGIPDLAEFVSAFVKTLNLTNMIVIGHSLGGAVSILFTREHPNLVNKLVLIGSAGFSRQVPLVFKLITLPLLGELLTLPSHANMERNLKFLVNDGACISSYLVDALHQYSILSGAQRALLKVMRASMDFSGVKKVLFEDNINRMGELTLPITIIWGDKDPILSVKNAYIAEEKFPNAKLHIFENCGHIPQIEYTDRFNQIIKDFISEK